MIQQPGGICFIHGPYDDMQCPSWPTCGAEIIRNGPNPKWVKLAEEKRVESVKQQIRDLLDTIN